jgi:hypothetical protein
MKAHEGGRSSGKLARMQLDFLGYMAKGESIGVCVLDESRAQYWRDWFAKHSYTNYKIIGPPHNKPMVDRDLVNYLWYLQGGFDAT